MCKLLCWRNAVLDTATLRVMRIVEFQGSCREALFAVLPYHSADIEAGALDFITVKNYVTKALVSTAYYARGVDQDGVRVFSFEREGN